MRRAVWCALIAVGLVLAGLQGTVAAGPPGRDGEPDRPPKVRPRGGLVTAGAASRSVLPTVDGARDYLDAGLPSDDDAVSPGVFVPEWDDGRIAVGNGDDVSHWVHDDLRVRALALDGQGPDRGSPVVLLSSDLYMIFRADADEIRAKVEQRLPPEWKGKVEVIVTATHNHHGPDTAFDVNHDWYDHMTDQAADAAVESILEMEPARLRVASGEHHFSLQDGTDPQVIDPRMNVLQAVRTNGRVIGTVVQWNSHPETTLGWEPPVDLSEECAVLGWTGDECTADGRYFTADYPGVLARTIEREAGGEVLYFVGALGHLVGPLGAEVWEVDADHPVGNGFTVPDGAAVPGGPSFTYTDRNFRRAVVIGEQAAEQALRLIEDGEWIEEPAVSWDEAWFYSRLSNIGFRFLLVPDPDTGRTSLGHNVPEGYTCPATGPKTDATCTDVGSATVGDPFVGEVLAADHLKSSVGYLRIGPVGMMFLPGEVAGELVNGLPAGFRTDPDRWYEEDPALHTRGDAFTTPGYVVNRMDDRYRFTIGLGNDELGYIFPISNWRVSCVADEVGGAGTCQGLHDDGIIEYPDAVAGTTCKAITEDPSLLAGYPGASALFVGASCTYGQALGEARGHYEETNSAGWDTAEDVLAAVAEVTGDADPAEVNPDFPGYWPGFPGPA